MRATRTLRLRVQYDGTGLYGFQRQRDPSKPTVQGLLEEAGRRLLGHPVRMVGAGRTDAGVHAVGQVVHFRTSQAVPAERIAQALNHRLPPAVRVVEAQEADPGFHARRDATSRIYCYHVLQHPLPSALLGRFSLWWPGSLQLAAMSRLAAQLVGRHRFDAFGSPTRPGGSTARTLFDCRVDAEPMAGGRLVRICFEADAFLYRMVRRLVGAMLAVGSGRLQAGDVLDALDESRRAGSPGERAGRRRMVAQTVSPAGLVLVHVHYGPPPAGLDGCGRILDTLAGLWLEWPRGLGGHDG